MINDPHSYLHRMGLMSSGIAKGSDRASKVKAVAVSVKRPPEFPSRTPAGPQEGHAASAARPAGDGWKPGAGKPARNGPETGPSQGFETAGSNRARAAGKRGVETKSAKSDVGAGAARRVGAKQANIEGNESSKYNKLEKKSMQSLKGGGSEKELRVGHNQAAPLPIDPAHPAMNPISNPQGFAAAGGAAHPMVRGQAAGAPAATARAGLHHAIGKARQARQALGNTVRGKSQHAARKR